VFFEHSPLICNYGKSFVFVFIPAFFQQSAHYSN